MRTRERRRETRKAFTMRGATWQIQRGYKLLCLWIQFADVENVENAALESSN